MTKGCGRRSVARNPGRPPAIAQLSRRRSPRGRSPHAAAGAAETEATAQALQPARRRRRAQTTRSSRCSRPRGPAVALSRRRATSSTTRWRISTASVRKSAFPLWPGSPPRLWPRGYRWKCRPSFGAGLWEHERSAIEPSCSISPASLLRWMGSKRAAAIVWHRRCGLGRSPSSDSAVRSVYRCGSRQNHPRRVCDFGDHLRSTAPRIPRTRPLEHQRVSARLGKLRKRIARRRRHDF